MQPEVNVPEALEVFKQICLAPEKMLRLELRGLVGEYLTVLMEWKLTIHPGRK